jgi:hypothetical protein
MRIDTAAAPPFMKNGFVVSSETTREAVLIDPGDEIDELLDVIERGRLQVKAILLTHAHLDHVTGVAAAKGALGVPIWLHKDDLFLYESAVEQGRMFGRRQGAAASRFVLRNESAVSIRRDVVDVIPTPTLPGRRVPRDRQGRLAAARPVRRRHPLHGIDRADRPAGRQPPDPASIDSNRAVRVSGRNWSSGHGPDTTIGRERRSNPFLA